MKLTESHILTSIQSVFNAFYGAMRTSLLMNLLASVWRSRWSHFHPLDNRFFVENGLKLSLLNLLNEQWHLNDDRNGLRCQNQSEIAFEFAHYLTDESKHWYVSCSSWSSGALTIGYINIFNMTIASVRVLSQRRKRWRDFLFQHFCFWLLEFRRCRVWMECLILLFM